MTSLQCWRSAVELPRHFRRALTPLTSAARRPWEEMRKPHAAPAYSGVPQHASTQHAGWWGGQDLHLRCERLNTHTTQPPRAAGLSRLSVGVSLPSRDRLSVCQRRFVPQPVVIIFNRAFPPSIQRDRRSYFFGDKPPWICRRLSPWHFRRLSPLRCHRL